MSELLPPPETPAEAITVLRALEAPGAVQELGQYFSEDTIVGTLDSVYAWYRLRMREGLPALQSVSSQSPDVQSGDQPLDATIHEDLDEFAADMWADGPEPEPFTAFQTEAVLMALRRVVTPNGRQVSYAYDSHRAADYLAERSPEPEERRAMAVVRAAITAAT